MLFCDIRLCLHQSGCRGPHLHWILPFFVFLPASNAQHRFDVSCVGCYEPLPRGLAGAAFTPAQPRKTLRLHFDSSELSGKDSGTHTRGRSGTCWQGVGVTGLGAMHGALTPWAPGGAHCACLRQAHHSEQEPCSHFTDEETGTRLSNLHKCQGRGGNTRGPVPGLGPNDHPVSKLFKHSEKPGNSA